MELPFAESYRIKMVEHIHRSTREEREQWIKEAKYNSTCSNWLRTKCTSTS